MSGEATPGAAAGGPIGRKRGTAHFLPRLALAFLIVTVLADQLAIAYAHRADVGNHTDCIDPNTEADTVRGGDGFAAHGLTSHTGLPDIAFGDRFPRYGVRNYLIRVPGEECIYTHQPPGALLIAGAVTSVAGTRGVLWLRVVPLAFGAFALVLLARSARARLGPLRAALAIAVILAPPLARDLLHALDCQSWAHASLLVELAILVGFFDGERSRARIVALGLVGFFAGWFLYDYFFVIALAAVPFALISPKTTRSALLAAIIAPTAGFALAGALHLLQVSVELGSLHAALADIGGSALHRVTGEGADVVGGRRVPGPTADLSLLPFLRSLARNVFPEAGIFRFDPTPVFVVAALVLATGFRLERPSFTIETSRRAALAIASAWVIAALWVLVMRQHSVLHPQYAAVKFFLPWFVTVLVLVECVRPRAPSSVAEARSSRELSDAQASAGFA